MNLQIFQDFASTGFVVFLKTGPKGRAIHRVFQNLNSLLQNSINDYFFNNRMLRLRFISRSSTYTRPA